MASRKKLTQSACASAKPDTKLWDSEIKGLALFAGKTRKTFFYQRDVNGKTTRSKIGIWGDGTGDTINAQQARTTAIQLSAEYATGEAQKRLAAARIPTLREAMETYLERPKLRSEVNKKAVRRQMEQRLSKWIDLPLDEINRDMCRKMHVTLTKRCANEKRANDGKVAANQILKSFRTIYNFARKTHDLPEAPTSAIEWHEESPSLKIIEDFEKWKAEVAAVENEVHRAFYYFLLLTGLRKMEAATLLWENVHEDHLHLPITKNGRPFDLPLLPEHHAIIEPLRKFHGDYVFPANRSSPHLREPARISWSPHVHRHTFATVAQFDAGLFEETVGRLINHTPTSVTGRRYIVSDHDRLREPMIQVVGAFKRKYLI